MRNNEASLWITCPSIFGTSRTCSLKSFLKLQSLHMTCMFTRRSDPDNALGRIWSLVNKRRDPSCRLPYRFKWGLPAFGSSDSRMNVVATFPHLTQVQSVEANSRRRTDPQLTFCPSRFTWPTCKPAVRIGLNSVRGYSPKTLRYFFFIFRPSPGENLIIVVVVVFPRSL